MWFRRGIRYVVALLVGCLPVLLACVCIIAATERQEDDRQAAGSVNPRKAPWYHSSGRDWLLGPIDDVAGFDPDLLGNIFWWWLLPGTILLVLTCAWAAGIPVLTKDAGPDWPMPGRLRMTLVSLAAGGWLSLPWLFDLARVLLR